MSDKRSKIKDKYKNKVYKVSEDDAMRSKSKEVKPIVQVPRVLVTPEREKTEINEEQLKDRKGKVSRVFMDTSHLLVKKPGDSAPVEKENVEKSKEELDEKEAFMEAKVGFGKGKFASVNMNTGGTLPITTYKGTPDEFKKVHLELKKQINVSDKIREHLIEVIEDKNTIIDILTDEINTLRRGNEFLTKKLQKVETVMSVLFIEHVKISNITEEEKELKFNEDLLSMFNE